MGESRSSTIACRVFEFDFDDYYKTRHHTPSYNSKSKQSKNIAQEEDSKITICAPYLKVIVTLKIVVIVIQIQLWRVLVPFFPTRVRMLMTFYVETDLVDHNNSFYWETNFPWRSIHEHLNNIFHRG